MLALKNLKSNMDPFFLSGCSFIDIENLQVSREKEGTILIPLCHYHSNPYSFPISNIQASV